jgi:integrase/recombinase XerD
LAKHYAEYLMHEYPADQLDLDDFYNDVFVVLKGDQYAQPLTYQAVMSLFERLEKYTGIKTHPHIFQHTHVTELVKAGVDLKVIQERVGHQSIQTTMDTYAHLSEEDFNQEIRHDLEGKNQLSRSPSSGSN